MIGFKEVLEYSTAGVFLALALIALRRWGRNGTTQAARWAALAFGSLGVVLLLSIVDVELPLWVGRAFISVLALFPYFLYRFATSFSPLRRWIDLAAMVLTAVVIVTALVLPDTFEDERQPAIVTLFTFVLLAQWSILSLIAFLRLWRAGKGLPTLARRRMRTMSLATIGLNLALLTGVFELSSTGAEIAVQVLAATSAVSFYVGFAPPRFIRAMWRQPEQEKLGLGVHQVMSAVTSEEVAETLLPHVAGIVGGRGAALIDGDEVVASYRAPTDTKKGDGNGNENEHVERIPLGNGPLTLQVWTSPYSPYFGPDEFTLLKSLGTLAEISLDRSRLFERERDSHAALERANRDLASANDELGKEIAERRRAQAELVTARKEAERANLAKSNFLSRMSHELRTPLNSILGFGQLLEMTELEKDQSESVHYILKAGQHLLDLINEILDISRIEAGTMTLSLEPSSAREVVQEAVDLIRPLADRRGVSLRVKLNEGSGLFFKADRQRLKQVLLNLLGNAVKYNRDEGSVTIALEESAGAALRVEIRDTGFGIRPDQMAKLFVPFERLGAETSRVEGTGLGLSLSKRLIELMGGEIGAESVLDAGSVFWIQMPTVEPPDQTPPTKASSRVKRQVATVHSLLYIEDNLANLTLIERILASRDDMKLITAMQAHLGVELAREHVPDLILLDLHLPDMPGEETLRELQRRPSTRGIPVVILSADATPGQVRRLMDAGAHDYLTKPLDVARFIQILDSALAPGEPVGR